VDTRIGKKEKEEDKEKAKVFLQKRNLEKEILL